MDTQKPLLKSSALTTTSGVDDGPVHYVPIPFSQARAHNQGLGGHIAWSAGADFTAELEFSDMPAAKAAADSTDAEHWVSKATIAGTPTGGDAGAVLFEYENVRHRRARLKITVAADSTLEVW